MILVFYKTPIDREELLLMTKLKVLNLLEYMIIFFLFGSVEIIFQ